MFRRGIIIRYVYAQYKAPFQATRKVKFLNLSTLSYVLTGFFAQAESKKNRRTLQNILYVSCQMMHSPIKL